MRLRMLLVPAAAAVTLFAAGCTGAPATTPTPTPTATTNGIEALEAEEILDRALDALDAAESFRVSGAAESGGQEAEIDTVYAGDLAQGTFKALGFSIEVVIAADGTYIRAGEELWTLFLPPEQADVVVPLLEGKYVKVPEDVALDSFLPTVDSLLAASGTWTKGEVTEYEGQQVITLEDDGGDGKLYIALVGEPYPLALVGEDGSTVTFTDFNKDVTIEAPAAEDVFDLAGFTG